MKSWLATGVIGVVLAVTGLRAEEPFSKAIRPEDFAAAELGKLSPEALARLDGLVQAYKSGAVATARAEAEQKAAKAAADLAAENAEKEKKKAKAESPGFFAKAKVLLAPGTTVEYGEIESEIAGDFTGWEGHTVFTLANGQRWKVANGGSYFCPTISRPKVKVFPATFGGFWMKFEGVSTQVKVVPFGAR